MEPRSSPLPKVCFTCYLNGYYLCIADLNDGVPEKRRLRKIQLTGFDSVDAFAFDDYEIYLFDSKPRCLAPVSLYSYELSKELSKVVSDEMSDLVLDKRALKDELLPVSPKKLCKFMRYRSKTLIFSSSIKLCPPLLESHSGRRNSVSNFLRSQSRRLLHLGYFDFELYDPISRTSKILPQLSIRLSRNSNRNDEEYPYALYELFDEERSVVVEFEGYNESGVEINGFSLVGDGDIFMIQTNLGRIFMIDISLSAPVWKVGVGDWDWEGGLCLHDSRFFVIANQFCVDERGVYKRRKITEDDMFVMWEKHCVDYEGLTSEAVRRMKKRMKDSYVRAQIRYKVECIDRRIPLLPTYRRTEKIINFADGMAYIVETTPPTATVMIVEFDLTKLPELDWSSSESFEEQIDKLMKTGDWDWIKKVKSVEFSFDGVEPLAIDVFPLRLQISN